MGTIDEVENLIKKHEAFEKAAAAQEERFAALERLTTFELKDMKRRQEEEQRAHADTIERQKAERYSRDQPDTRSDTSSIRETKSGDGELEGMLVRKHEWESTTKKASNRSWEKICVVLKESQIFFYKDQKTYRTHPGDTFKGETPVDLINCTAEVATDYTKKKYVFRLRLANGGFYLFQAADEEQMDLWVNGINAGPASRGGIQEPDPATWVGEEGRTKEKIVLHSQEKVILHLMMTPYPLFL